MTVTFQVGKVVAAVSTGMLFRHRAVRACCKSNIDMGRVQARVEADDGASGLVLEADARVGERGLGRGVVLLVAVVEAR